MFQNVAEKRFFLFDAYQNQNSKQNLTEYGLIKVLFKSLKKDAAITKTNAEKFEWINCEIH